MKKAARQNVNQIPEIGFMRETEVLKFVPVGRSTLWSMAKSGGFPRPIKLSPRVTVWRCEDVRAWIKKAGEPTPESWVFKDAEPVQVVHVIGDFVPFAK